LEAGELNICFADDLVLLVSSEQGLQYALDRCAAAYDQAGMKISTKIIRLSISPETKAVYAASKWQYIAAVQKVHVSFGGIYITND